MKSLLYNTLFCIPNFVSGLHMHVKNTTTYSSLSKAIEKLVTRQKGRIFSVFVKLLKTKQLLFFNTIIFCVLCWWIFFIEIKNSYSLLAIALSPANHPDTNMETTIRCAPFTSQPRGDNARRNAKSGQTKLSNGLRRRRTNEHKHKKGQPGTRM